MLCAVAEQTAQKWGQCHEAHQHGVHVAGVAEVAKAAKRRAFPTTAGLP